MLKIHQIPNEEIQSKDYAVMLNGECVELYQCRVSAIPFNTVWPGYQRPIEQTEPASFIYFSMDETDSISVRVQVPHDFKEAVIRPLSSKITTHIDGNTVAFIIDKPGQYTFEIDGYHNALHIFANPQKSFDVDFDSEEVIYFGPGVHRPGIIELKSRQTLYIDDGAVVHASIEAHDGNDIQILGHGILDNSEFIRTGEHGQITPTSLRLYNCENVTVYGVIFKDACGWTVTAFNCANLIFDNVKTIGMWRYNSDGLDMVNSKNAVIRNCFLRNFDDVVVLKGFPPYDNKNVENITVEKCVLWCDWGRALEIGAETCAEQYRNITFTDCDVIHSAHMALDIQNSGYAHVRQVLFENIRVEYSKYCEEPIYQQSIDMVYKPKPETHMPFLMLAEVTSYYADMLKPGCVYGKNSDIRYENIQAIVDEGLPVPPSYFSGISEISDTKNIYIKDLYINGKRCESLEEGNITAGAFAGNINIE